MLDEIVVNSGEELWFTNPSHELAKRGCALGVGDAVEVNSNGVKVDHVGGDRVGRGQLVLTVGPGLALV